MGLTKALKYYLARYFRFKEEAMQKHMEITLLLVLSLLSSLVSDALKIGYACQSRALGPLKPIIIGNGRYAVGIIGRAALIRSRDASSHVRQSTSSDVDEKHVGSVSKDDRDYNLDINFDDDDLSISDSEILTPEVYRREHGINLKGEGALTQDFAPLVDFEATPYSSILKSALDKAGYTAPTSIQAQSWPVALSKRDLISVARTGSGKTCGFLLPALHILMENRANRRKASVKESGDSGERRRTYSVRRNPSVLVLAPTRELAMQIEQEAQKFTRAAGVYSMCMYGGTPKGPQIGMLRRGVDIIVATPGRCNDLAEMGILNLADVSYLVLDEADRMLDMGFEPQIRTILEQCHAKRQSLFFTATWPREVRSLASDYLTNPIQIQIGDQSGKLTANKAIEQNIIMIEEYDKYDKLMDVLEDINPTEDKNPKKVPKTIVFLSRKSACDALAYDLRKNGYYVDSLHGDKSQNYRQIAMERFRNNRLQVLVATDVAARGLDVKDINTVINYDFPVGTSGVEDYVHRIGRTGRAENSGRSFTFFTRGDADRANELCGVLTRSDQEVPQALEEMCKRRRRGVGPRRDGGGGRGYRGGGEGRGKINSYRRRGKGRKSGGEYHSSEESCSFGTGRSGRQYNPRGESDARVGGGRRTRPGSQDSGAYASRSREGRRQGV